MQYECIKGKLNKFNYQYIFYTMASDHSVFYMQMIQII